MSSKRKTRSRPQAVAREMSTMKFKKGRLMGRPRKNRPLKLRITTPVTWVAVVCRSSLARAIDLSAFHYGLAKQPLRRSWLPATSTASNDLSVCAARHRLALQVPRSSSGRRGSCYPLHCRPGHSEKTANDRWGDIMARAGPYYSGGGGWGLPASAATGNAIGLLPYLPPEQRSTLPPRKM